MQKAGNYAIIKNMKINSEAEMLALGRKFAKNLTLPTVFELVGDVGAGKTTFSRGLAAGLGVREAVTSPSFTISKRYAFSLPEKRCKNYNTSETSSGSFVHYDFYRLDDPGIMRAELAEALAHPNSVIVVEWGGDVADLLPKHKIRIEFSLTPDGSRELTISDQSASAANLVLSAQEPVSKIPAVPKAPVSSAAKAPSASSCELYLDTSTNLCQLKINDKSYSWDSGRVMAEQIFSFIRAKLAENGYDWPDISQITYYSGPGSFTGLRIGAAIVNVLADQLQIPLYDHHVKKHQIILPDYGRPANISAPRK